MRRPAQDRRPHDKIQGQSLQFTSGKLAFSNASPKLMNDETWLPLSEAHQTIGFGRRITGDMKMAAHFDSLPIQKRLRELHPSRCDG